MFLYERSSDAYALMLQANRAANLQHIEYFEVHVQCDPGHAQQWLETLCHCAQDAETQQAALAAGRETARRFQALWDAMIPGWTQWKETGEPPHCPAAELRMATGM